MSRILNDNSTVEAAIGTAVDNIVDSEIQNVKISPENTNAESSDREIYSESTESSNSEISCKNTDAEGPDGEISSEFHTE